MSGSVPVSQVLMLRICRDNHQRVCLASVSVQGIYGQSLESIVPLGDAQNVDSDVKSAYVMCVSVMRLGSRRVIGMMGKLRIRSEP